MRISTCARGTKKGSDIMIETSKQVKKHFEPAGVLLFGTGTKVLFLITGGGNLKSRKTYVMELNFGWKENYPNTKTSNANPRKSMSFCK